MKTYIMLALALMWGALWGLWTLLRGAVVEIHEEDVVNEEGW